MKQRLIASLFAFVLTVVLTGCASKLRNEELQEVAKDWSYVIRASQVIPVYPPSEDLQPGDVLLVSTPIDQQAKLYEKKGFLPLDQLLVRLDSVEFSSLWGDDTFRDFYKARYGIESGAATPGHWQTSGWKDAPRASFPTYNFSVKSGAGLNLAIPISGVPFGLGLMSSDQANGTVTLSDAYTFGLDNFRLQRIVVQWARANRTLLRNYEPTDEGHHFLRVVARVYVVGGVDVTMFNDEATSAEAKAGADRPVNLLAVESQNTDTNYQGTIEQINTLAEKVAPGGTLKFASASSRAVTMKETFPRPLVIGYVGFDLPILKGGRTGAPISTLAQLTHQKSIPADVKRDNVYREAALNHMYAALSAIEGTDAKRIIANLDAMAKALPPKYPFTMHTLNGSSLVRNDDPESAMAGNDIDRTSFTAVTDYLSEATATIKAIETALPGTPETTEEERAVSSKLRQELKSARIAHEQAASILRSDPALTEAFDFLFP